MSAPFFLRRPVFDIGPLDNTNSLAGYWPLDGNTLDYSGKGNNVTVTGTSQFVLGQTRQAFKFSGTTSLGSGSNLGITDYGISNWSAACWFFITNPDNPVTLMGYGNGDISPYYFWMICVNAVSPHLEFRAYDGTNNVVSAPNNTTMANTWQHASVTYSNGSAVLYLNGSVVASGSVPTKQRTGAADAVSIGLITWTTQGGPMVGNIYDARVYNRVLSGGEVSSLYNASAFIPRMEGEMPVVFAPAAGGIALSRLTPMSAGIIMGGFVG